MNKKEITEKIYKEYGKENIKFLTIEIDEDNQKEYYVHYLVLDDIKWISHIEYFPINIWLSSKFIV